MNEPLTTEQRSRIQNAARDVADAFLRFERETARLQRAIEGVDRDAANFTIRAALDGRRAEAWETMAARLT